MKERQNSRNQNNFIRKHSLRILFSLVLLLAVFVLPLLSEARYKAFLNGFAAVIAKEYYFSSNYLKEDENPEDTIMGANYLLNGWDGADLVMDDVQIRNYDNTLLTNQVGQDLKYEMTWEVRTYDKNDVEITEAVPYKLKVDFDTKGQLGGTATAKPSDMTMTGDDRTGRVTASIKGTGVSQRHNFTMELIAPEMANLKEVMTNGCYVIVILVAKNAGDDQRNQYNRTISATMRYNVSVLENFIDSFTITEPTDDDDITITIRTSTIPGATGMTQKIYLWWDLEYFRANRFNSQFNTLFLEGKYEEITVASTQKTYGRLEISAKSLTTRTFELIKQKPSDIVSADGKNYSYVLQGKSYTEIPSGESYYIGYYMPDQDAENEGESDAAETTAAETTAAETTADGTDEEATETTTQESGDAA